MSFYYRLTRCDKEGTQMEEIVLKKDKFDGAMLKIESNLKNNKKIAKLDKFDESSGPFGLFPKKITGQEMNIFTTQLQNILLKTNEKINDYYSHFLDVYAALEALDKEYLSGIVGAFNQAVEATKKAEDAQRDIKKTIEALQKVVTKIEDFNSKVNFELCRIDSDNWKENAVEFEKAFGGFGSEIEEMSQTLNLYKNRYEKLKNQLESLKKEERKTKITCLIASIMAGCSALAIIALILLIVFNVL